MKHFEITFKNGLLIDSKTGNKLNLKPFAKYVIAGDEEDFTNEDYKTIKNEPLDSIDKLMSLQSQFKAFHLEKIAEQGDEFYFRIGLPKRFKDDVDNEYLFKARILEDLYLRRKVNNKNANWSLCDCLCECSELIDGKKGLPFNKVLGTSLSNLFAQVVSEYFNQKRSTACNALTTFCYPPKMNEPSLDWIKNSDFRRNIHDRRKEVIEDYRKEK